MPPKTAPTSKPAEPVSLKSLQINVTLYADERAAERSTSEDVWIRVVSEWVPSSSSNLISRTEDLKWTDFSGNSDSNFVKMTTYKMDYDPPSLTGDLLRNFNSNPGIFSFLMKKNEDRVIPFNFCYLDCSSFLLETGELSCKSDISEGFYMEMKVILVTPVVKKDDIVDKEPVVIYFDRLFGFPCDDPMSTQPSSQVYSYGKFMIGAEMERRVLLRPVSHVSNSNSMLTTIPSIPSSDESSPVPVNISSTQSFSTTATFPQWKSGRSSSSSSSSSSSHADDGGSGDQSSDSEEEMDFAMSKTLQPKTSSHLAAAAASSSSSITYDRQTLTFQSRLCFLPGCGDLRHFQELLTVVHYQTEIYQETSLSSRVFTLAMIDRLRELLESEKRASTASKPSSALGNPRGSSKSNCSPSDQWLMQAVFSTLDQSRQCLSRGIADYRLQGLLQQAPDWIREFQHMQQLQKKTEHVNTDSQLVEGGEEEELVVIEEPLSLDLRPEKPSRPQGWHRPDDLSLSSVLSADRSSFQSSLEKVSIDPSLPSLQLVQQTLQATARPRPRKILPWYERFHICGTHFALTTQLLRKPYPPLSLMPESSLFSAASATTSTPSPLTTVSSKPASPGTSKKPTTATTTSSSSTFNKSNSITPFSRLVIFFRYDQDEVLESLQNSMQTINLRALPDIQGTLRSYSLQPLEVQKSIEGCPDFDLLTGFMVIDDDYRLVFLEGLAGREQGLHQLYHDLPSRYPSSSSSSPSSSLHNADDSNQQVDGTRRELESPTMATTTPPLSSSSTTSLGLDPSTTATANPNTTTTLETSLAQPSYKVLYNPDIHFDRRLYPDWGPELKRIRLRDRLTKLGRRPEFYNRLQVEEQCFDGLEALLSLRRGVDMRSLKSYQIFPSQSALIRMEQLYGEAISRQDLDGGRIERERQAKKEKEAQMKRKLIEGGSSTTLSDTKELKEDPMDTLGKTGWNDNVDGSALSSSPTESQRRREKECRMAATDCHNPDFEHAIRHRPPPQDYLEQQRQLLQEAKDARLLQTLPRQLQQQMAIQQILVKSMENLTQTIHHGGVNSTSTTKIASTTTSGTPSRTNSPPLSTSSSPTPSNAKIFIYSTQRLNAKALQVDAMKRRLGKDKNSTFTYSRDFLSQSLAVGDISDALGSGGGGIGGAASSSVARVDDRSHWLTPSGFMYPRPKQRADLIRHPKKPTDARIEDLHQPWDGDLPRGMDTETLRKQQLQLQQQHQHYPSLDHKNTTQDFTTLPPHPHDNGDYYYEEDDSQIQKQREQNFVLRFRPMDVFGGFPAPTFEHDYRRPPSPPPGHHLPAVPDVSSISTSNLQRDTGLKITASFPLPRGHQVGGKSPNPDFFQSVHLQTSTPQAQQELHERKQQELETWKAKVVVDHLDFKVGGFRVRDRPVPCDRPRDILKHEPSTKALKHLRERTSSSGRSDYSYAPSPWSLHAQEEFRGDAPSVFGKSDGKHGDGLFLRKDHPHKFVTTQDILKQTQSVGFNKESTNTPVGDTSKRSTTKGNTSNSFADSGVNVGPDFQRHINRHHNVPKSISGVAKRSHPSMPVDSSERQGPHWEPLK